MKEASVTAMDFNKPVTVKEFRDFIGERELTGYQARKLFRLTVEELVDLMKLMGEADEIELFHVQHLYHLYHNLPYLVPELTTYEQDAAKYDSLVMNIQPTRPVRGGDVKLLRTVHGLTTDEARSFFRMSPNSYAAMTGKGALAPVLNPTIALLTRVWAKHPVFLPKTRDYTFDEISKVIPDSPRNCGIALGKQQSSSTRWGHDVSMTPVVRAAAKVMVQMTVDLSYEHWLEFVRQEATSRGVDDVFAEGHWNKEQIKGDHQMQVEKHQKHQKS